MRPPFRFSLPLICLAWLSACGGEPTPTPSPTDPVLVPEPTPDPTPEPAPARPFVTGASLGEGAQDVYPVELYFDAAASRPGIYLRKQLSVTFSAPMLTSLARVTLQDRSGGASPRVLTGAWSEDGRTLRLTVLAPEDGGPPLEERTAYALDLTALRGAGGEALEPTAFLSDGALDFTTAGRQGDLEHACTHALANEPEAVRATAAPPPEGFPPATDTGHARYRVTLPDDAGHGYTELVSRPSQDEDIVFYLDRALEVGVLEEETGAQLSVHTHAATPVCAGITHVAHFTVRGGDRFYYPHFRGSPGTAFEFILERHAR